MTPTDALAYTLKEYGEFQSFLRMASDDEQHVVELIGKLLGASIAELLAERHHATWGEDS